MRRSGLAIGGFCAVSAVLSPSASLAQDGGLRMVFGLENRLEIVRNSDLSVPATGTDVTDVTRLSFGLTSETAIDRLDFSATGALIAENNAGSSGTELDFGRAAVTLAYHREVPASVLDINAEFRNDNIDAFDDDLADVDEAGTRTDTALSARLETGRTSSIGFALGAAYESTDYQDASDPELDDSTETRADVAVIFHASETVTGRVGLRYRKFEEENPGTRTVEETTGYVGLEYAISERLDLLAELGYIESEDEDFDIIERARGPEISIGLTYAMPVGTALALLSVTTDADEGQRETFVIGRDLETPANTISARLGVTHADTTGTDLIGSLRLDHPLPDGSLGLNVERRVSFDTDDDEPVTTSLISIDWAKNVNEVSSIGLDLSYEQSDSPSERIEQVTFGADYSYRLTEDWNLNSGVGYRVRHDADGRSESPNLFVSLSREFELRP
jgi:hypothetical protein